MSVRRILTVAILAVVSILPAFVLSAPSFAAPAQCPAGSTTCANVSASVTQSITLTGITTSVTFPAATPGNTATVTAAEAYTIATNDALGYTLTATAGATSFTQAAPATGTIPDTAWTIAEKNTAPTVTFSPTATGVQVNKTAAPATGDLYSENWSLAIPAAAAPGAYTNTLTYLAVGN
jgi:hypothetical protein